MCSTNMAVNDRLVAFEFTTLVDCTVCIYAAQQAFAGGRTRTITGRKKEQLLKCEYK